MLAPRPRPWRIAFPLFAVLVIAGAWVGYWYLALDTARREFARLGDRGIRIDCAGEEWAGFPFRVTLVCERPTFRIGTGGVTLAGEGARLSATAMIYRPTHVIAELAGPSTVTQTRAPDPAGTIPDQISLVADRGPIRAGLQLDHDGISRVSAHLTDWSGRLVARARDRTLEDAAVQADRLAVHWARPTDDDADPGLQQIALEATGLAIAGTLPAGLGIDRLVLDRVELAAAVTRVMPDLKAWQAAEGKIRIDHLALTGGDRQATGTGTVHLDDQGRLDGTLDLVVKDLDVVFDELIASGRLTGDQATLAATALRLLATGGEAPEPGWSRVPVRLSRGRLYFGPFKAGQIAPLF